MHITRIVLGALFAAALTRAYDQLLGCNVVPQTENRTVDQIYQAALAQGGVVTCWHGGDAPHQQNTLKKLFEAKYPGMTLNITAELSKYLAPRLDQQLAAKNVYVDSVIIQTLHDYPRWKDQGALLRYKPLGFDNISPQFRDASGAFYGVVIWSWSFVWNTQKSSSMIRDFTDFLKPEYKDKLVLTYPTDDDAILFQFYLILDQYGTPWFDALLTQNPTWVRGTATPSIIISQANSSAVATFTSTYSQSVSLPPPAPLNISFPVNGQFMSWPQTAAILTDAPNPDGAKLLHAYYLSDEYQRQVAGVTVRRDMTVPNQPFNPTTATNTDPTQFAKFMADRVKVERLRFYFEQRIGIPTGPDSSL